MSFIIIYQKVSNWKNNQPELISERKGDITGIFQRSKEEGVGVGEEGVGVGEEGVGVGEEGVG